MIHKITGQLSSISLVIAATLLGSCAATGAPPAQGTTIAPAPSAEELPPATGSWRSVATARDRERLRGWWAAWQAALASARAGGHGPTVEAEGVILNPLIALPNPHLPPGDYRCRTIKLGAQQPGGLAYVSYPWFRCRVTAEQDMFSFEKLSGSQRQVGLIFDDTDRRKIFLGTLVLGDEQRALDYGADANRDLAGILERVGPMRWRIAFPRPAFESLVDVLEVVPAPAG